MDPARQQIVDSINTNSNILVSVSTNPTVDELSAALGLTILLNNLDKRSTAVFSGTIPAAINFLEPDKTFEDSADSLRDFIIALDKEKADHLRYKVEGDVVRIFITPYRTKLSQSDLDFSQGDYNVELVIGVGVKDQEHLDKALESHGKILHDATVVTITAGTDASNLGSVDWHDPAASSLSEMIVSLADGLKTDQSLLDEQISTALLTGIVSSTDRFSNDHTTSAVMTMAAQLMAAGANQQLIAAKLEEAHDIGTSAVSSDSSTVVSQDPDADHGSELSIDRSDRRSKTLADIEKDIESAAAQPEPQVEEVINEETTQIAADEEVSQSELEKELAQVTAAPASDALEQIEKELQSAVAEQPASDAKPIDEAPADTPPVVVEPLPELVIAPEPEPEPLPEPKPKQSVPETPLTATSDAFMPGFEPTEITLPTSEPDTAVPQVENDHGLFTAPSLDQSPPINSAQADAYEGEGTIDPFSTPINQAESTTIVPDFGLAGTEQGAALLASDPVTPVAPFVQLDASGIPELPPLPPLPSFDALPPLPPPPPAPNFAQPATTTMSGAVSGDIFGDDSAVTQPQADPAQAPEPVTPVAPEPGQFKIPGMPSS